MKKAKKYNPYDDLVLCDLRLPPFRKDSFDIVIALEVIEHMKKKEGRAFIHYLEELCRGTLIISTPLEYYPQEEFDGNVFQKHRGIWTKQEIQHLGFETKEFGPLLSRFKVLVFPALDRLEEFYMHAQKRICPKFIVGYKQK